MPDLTRALARRRKSMWVRRVVGLAALMFLLGSMAVVVLTVVGATAWVVYVKTRPISVVMTQPPRVPLWQLDLPPGLPPASISDLDTWGADAMRDDRYDVALEHFYRSLHFSPGRQATERLAFHAGEHLVLDALEPILDDRVDVKQRYESYRDRLIRDLDRGGARAARAERRLIEDYRDDLDVRHALRLGESEVGAAQAERLRQGAELASRGEWAAAAAIYTEVYDQAVDPILRTNARAGLHNASSHLTRDTVQQWRGAMIADASGDVETVLSATDVLLDRYPADASAAALRARYGVEP